MTAVNYLWNPINDNIVEEFDDAGNTIAEYTTEPDQFGDVISQFRDGQETFYHYDGQGSTLSLTNASGDVTDTYAYSGFGEVTNRIGNAINPFQYVGQKQYYWEAETEEYQVRQRPMSPIRQRWLAVDPLALQHRELTVPPSIHIPLSAYGYANNCPLKYVDPTGLVPRTVTVQTECYGIFASTQIVIATCRVTCVCKTSGLSQRMHEIQMKAFMLACCTPLCEVISGLLSTCKSHPFDLPWYIATPIKTGFLIGMATCLTAEERKLNDPNAVCLCTFPGGTPPIVGAPKLPMPKGQ